MTETVAQAAQKTTGSTWNVEGTGGGCEVLQTALEGGVTLVLEQNLCVPVWADTELALDWTLGAYEHSAWIDGGEAVAVDWFTAPLTPQTLADALDAMLAALPTLVRL